MSRSRSSIVYAPPNLLSSQSSSLAATAAGYSNANNTHTSRLRNQPPTFIDPLTQGVLFRQYELTEVENTLVYDLSSSLAMTLHTYTGFVHFVKYLFLSSYPSITTLKEKRNGFNFHYNLNDTDKAGKAVSPFDTNDDDLIQNYLNLLERDIEYAQQHNIIPKTHYQVISQRVPQVPQTTTQINNRNDDNNDKDNNDANDANNNDDDNANNHNNNNNNDSNNNNANNNNNNTNTIPNKTIQIYIHNNIILSSSVYKSIALDDVLDDIQYNTQYHQLNINGFFQQRSDEMLSIVSSILPCGFFCIKAWTHCESLRITYEELSHEYNTIFNPSSPPSPSQSSSASSSSSSPPSSHGNNSIIPKMTIEKMRNKITKLNVLITTYNDRMNTCLNDIYTWLRRNPVLSQLLESLATNFIDLYDSLHPIMKQPSQETSNNNHTDDDDHDSMNTTSVQIIGDNEWDFNMVHNRTRSTVVDTHSSPLSNNTKQRLTNSATSLATGPVQNGAELQDSIDNNVKDDNGNDNNNNNNNNNNNDSGGVDDDDYDQYYASQLTPDHDLDLPPLPPPDIEQVYDIEYFPQIKFPTQQGNDPKINFENFLTSIKQDTALTLQFTRLDSLHNNIVAQLQQELYRILIVLHEYYVFFEQTQFFHSCSHQRVYDYLDVNEHFFDLLHINDPYLNKSSTQNNTNVDYSLYISRIQLLLSQNQSFKACSSGNTNNSSSSSGNSNNSSSSTNQGNDHSGENDEPGIIIRYQQLSTPIPKRGQMKQLPGQSHSSATFGTRGPLQTPKSSSQMSIPVELNFVNKHMDVLCESLFAHKIGGVDVPLWYKYEHIQKGTIISYFYIPPSFDLHDVYQQNNNNSNNDNNSAIQTNSSVVTPSHSPHHHLLPSVQQFPRSPSLQLSPSNLSQQSLLHSNQHGNIPLKGLRQPSPTPSNIRRMSLSGSHHAHIGRSFSSSLLSNPGESPRSGHGYILPSQLKIAANIPHQISINDNNILTEHHSAVLKHYNIQQRCHVDKNHNMNQKQTPRFNVSLKLPQPIDVDDLLNF